MSPSSAGSGSNRIRQAVENHAGGGPRGATGPRGGEIRIVRHGKPELVLQRADDEFPDREHAAMVEERADAQVRIDTFDLRRIDAAVGQRPNHTVADSFARSVAASPAIRAVTPVQPPPRESREGQP